MEDTKRTGPRDVFTHLLAIIFLYVCVITFSTLIFGYINIYFPDLLQGDFGRYARAGIRFPLATLVIVFPLYLWLNSFLQKDLTKYPEKRELKVRKWLIYFTLFLATIVIVGDLVTLIYQFLSGGITVRFLLKVLTVLLIAGAVFLYYGWNLKQTIAPMKDPRMKLFVQGVSGLGLLTLLAGFFVVGSPGSERMLQYDDQRVWHLSSIQSEIINYWQTKESLPPTLDALSDPLRGFVTPVDPLTGEPYEYTVQDRLSFALCATFQVSSEETDSFAKPVPMEPYGMNETWSHGVGRTCFERTIDPERFPPVSKRPL